MCFLCDSAEPWLIRSLFLMVKWEGCGFCVDNKLLKEVRHSNASSWCDSIWVVHHNNKLTKEGLFLKNDPYPFSSIYTRGAQIQTKALMHKTYKQAFNQANLWMKELSMKHILPVISPCVPLDFPFKMTLINKQDKIFLQSIHSVIKIKI